MQPEEKKPSSSLPLSDCTNSNLCRSGVLELRKLCFLSSEHITQNISDKQVKIIVNEFLQSWQNVPLAKFHEWIIFTFGGKLSIASCLGLD